MPWLQAAVEAFVDRTFQTCSKLPQPAHSKSQISFSNGHCSIPVAIYPDAARRAGQTGSANVAIWVNRSDEVVATAVVKTSKFPMLDNSAEIAAQKAQCHIRSMSDDATVGVFLQPINFELKD